MQGLVCKQLLLSTDVAGGVKRCVARWAQPACYEHLQWSAEGDLSILAAS
jgi:hypothetical protein